jgi:glycosyltransferase involved in cell wall biosynthesis
MLDSALFSIIVLHYNQENYLYTALDSVLNQSYDRIELIFTDDCSFELDRDRLENYIETNKKENLKNFVIQINDTNLGTVKNINNAVKKCSGEYILFFAADDCLFDRNTIQNFVDSFQTLPNDRLMVSGQCYMLDEDLEELQNNFVDVNLAKQLNNSSALEQYKLMAFYCLYAMGATAVKKGYLKNMDCLMKNIQSLKTGPIFCI